MPNLYSQWSHCDSGVCPIAVAANSSMKWGEAKRLVLQEWDDWAAKNVPPGQQAPRGTMPLDLRAVTTLRKPNTGLPGVKQVLGWPLPLPETQASVLGMANMGINVPAPKEEYSCQTSELIRNDRASIA